MPRLPLLAFLLVACQSSGYHQARAASDRTENYGEELERLAKGIDQAAAALRTLAENPGDSPRSNRETFQTFEREQLNLRDAAADARRAFERMETKAELFFGAWSEDTAAIQGADLRKSAETRRSALEAGFRTLGSGQVELEKALEGFLAELEDLRLYLEHDLTAAGIGSAREPLTRVQTDARTLRERLGAQARAAEAARASLEPLKDQAPPPRAPARAEPRVR